MTTHAYQANPLKNGSNGLRPGNFKGKPAGIWISMTEWFIVLATALAGLFLADPFFGGWLARSVFAKVLTVGAVTVALSFHLLARATFDPVAFGASSRKVFSRWWPITVLAIFIIAGSSYAIKVEHIKSNFLNFGLSMLFLPAMAISIDSSRNPMGLLKWLGIVYVLTVLTFLIEMPFTKSTHHEEIFVAVPLGIYFLSAAKLNIWKLLLGFSLIGACAFSIKNTTFIMMGAVIMTAFLLWTFRLAKIKDGLKAAVFLMCAVLFCGAFLSSTFVAWLKFKHKLPHGNTEYREEMYKIAWDKFLDSPVWGTSFAGESVTYFGLYKVDMPTPYLPTHSDILDILANGGVIGFSLWLLTVVNVFFFLYVSLKRLAGESLENEQAWRCMLVLSMLQICGIITYAVNPPLINPLHGYWIWGGLAVTWALWRQLTQGERPAPRRVNKAW